jgi:hypothetical protein
MRGPIFISYRRAANAWAIERLRQELVGAFGERNIFFDTETIRAGDRWSQSIDEAIRDASVVVVVFCHEWYGTRGDGELDGRRIDEPGDTLRFELESALTHGKPIIPIIIDASPQPRPEELPASVRAVCDRQFLRIDISKNSEMQLDRLVNDIRRQTSGHDWAWRLTGHAGWIALIALSIGLALHHADADEWVRQAFARAAFALRDRIVHKAPSISVVQMTELEYKELFGGRSPLDPELMAIALRRLHAATSDQCGPSRPIVIDLDLAPSSEDADQRQQHMTQALLTLASCRPLVLACPSAVRRGSEAWHERRWMLQLKRDSTPKPEAEPRILFATRQADPEGLRRADGRSELGVAAADVAAERKPFALHPRRDCICPDTSAMARQCAVQPIERDWDGRGFAVPLPLPKPWADDLPLPPGYGGFFSLSEAIAHADVLMRSDAVLIGTNRSTARYAVPGRTRHAFDGVSATVVHAHLFNGAFHHEPHRGSWAKGLTALLVAWLAAGLVLIGGRELERNDDRLVHRGPAYAFFIAGLLGLPLLALVAAALAPAMIWWLAVVTLVAMLAAGRALVGCFELVLSRGVSWRWPAALLRETQGSGPRGSAYLRLSVFVAEALIIGSCAAIALGG